MATASSDNMARYIIGHEGRLAVVNHTTQEITLADAAFKRLHGFYIFPRNRPHFRLPNRPSVNLPLFTAMLEATWLPNEQPLDIGSIFRPRQISKKQPRMHLPFG